MSAHTYSVPAITCDHCGQAIEAEVSRLDGVRAVAVDVPAKTVWVDGDADPDSIRAAIEEAGYETDGIVG
jgi:copper ion binding protein